MYIILLYILRIDILKIILGIEKDKKKYKKMMTGENFKFPWFFVF